MSFLKQIDSQHFNHIFTKYQYSSIFYLLQDDYIYMCVCVYTYPGVSYPVPARDIFHAKLQALLADAEEYGATLALRTQLRGGQVYQEGWACGHKKFMAMGDGQIMVKKIIRMLEAHPEVWMKLTSESITVRLNLMMPIG